jgi:GT2 family glycosyltransferase
MISIILPSRNAAAWTGRALASIRHSLLQLGWGDVEMILLDDDSDPKLGILPLFKEFRNRSGLTCRIVHFKTHQHYSRVFSAGLSIAKGDKVFFLSNDMIFTPDFFRVLAGVSDLDKSIGIVRATSNYVDSHPEHMVDLPKPQMTFGEIVAFSQSIASKRGHEFVVDSLLSADAVLIQRALIDAIGTVDPIYFGYFGDVDYGLRAIRAGFKLVCAKGAWIFHEGAGHIKDRYLHPEENPGLDTERELLVQKGYEIFRTKWDKTLPERYDPGQSLAFPGCLALRPPDQHRYVAPAMPSADTCEMA